MLPNAIGPILTSFTFSVATAILTVSSLSYIGLGITAPTPEWGSMLSAGKELLRQAPHVLLFPGLMIMVTVLALNLFGDGLRDALDPRLK
jgi:peptide/nickel transport system permease protein